MFGIELIDATLAPAMFVALLSGGTVFFKSLYLADCAALFGLYKRHLAPRHVHNWCKGAQPDWGSFVLCDGSFDGLFAFGLYGLGLWALFSKPC